MKIIDRFAKKLGYVKTTKRNFNSADVSRLTSDWNAPQTTGDAEMRNNLQLRIQRARTLETENDYIRRWLKLLRNNVLGHKGMGLEMQIANADGAFIESLNAKIEDAFCLWSEPENFSWDGAMGRQEMDELILQRCAIDGGILLREIHDPSKLFGICYQPFEIDQLDLRYNVRIAIDQEVRMGVEFFRGKRIAYHMWDRHPGDFGFMTQSVRLRIPASEILHIRWTDRVNQTHGLPWCNASQARLRQLNGYEEAEVVAARVAACKATAITPAVPDGYKGETDTRGNVLEDMEPGATRLLNPGDTINAINPTHPNTALPEFLKSQLRGIAAGLGVSYNALANDLSDVNYGSLRGGSLEDREEWKTVQTWFSRAAQEPRFKAWLPFAIASGQLDIPMLRANGPMPRKWQCRRWPWIDPLKDGQAVVLALENNLTSHRAELAEDGRDVEDVFQEIAADKRLAQAYGLGELLLSAKVPPVQKPLDNNEEPAKAVSND